METSGRTEKEKTGGSAWVLRSYPQVDAGKSEGRAGVGEGITWSCLSGDMYL